MASVVGDYNVIERWREFMKKAVKYGEDLVESLAESAKDFILDLRHMVFMFSVITIVLMISIVLRDFIVDGGGFIKVFLDLISFVILVIYDAIHVVFSAANDVTSFFTGHSYLPNLPTVSPTYFFSEADKLDDVSRICQPFTDAWYDVFYIPRKFLNSYTCFWLRYLYPTVLRHIFMPLFGWASFDPTPDLTVFDGNCQQPEMGNLCFLISLEFPLGKIVIPWYWPLMVLIHFRKPIWMTLKLMLELIKEAFKFLIIIIHCSIHLEHKVSKYWKQP